MVRFNITIPTINQPDFNVSWIRQHFIEWSLQGYTDIVGFFIFPILFSGVIGYIYTRNMSATSAAGAILILFACFGGSSVLMHVQIAVMFFQLIFSLAVTGLLLVFITRRRG